MSKIKLYGSKILTQKCKETSLEIAINISKELEKYIYAGLGIAAPQIGYLERVFLVRNPSTGKTETFYNPVLLEGKDKEMKKEGCVSYPGILIWVSRFDFIEFKAFNLIGKEVTRTANKLLAHIIQHEVNHLEGITLIDHMTVMDRMRLKNKLKKIKRINKRLENLNESI